MGNGVLAAVLSNPPTTAGTRTRARVGMLADLLAYDRVLIGNLFARPTRSFDDLSTAGQSEDGWGEARDELSALVVPADAVLLAWGTRPPAGPAGVWHRNQVTWLLDQVRSIGVPTIMVGDAPRHPSRWQRWTAAQRPGEAFPVALVASCQWTYSEVMTDAGSRVRPASSLGDSLDP